jgi:alpha-galactosidase
MTEKPVITVIGAASTTFGPKVLRDILNHPHVGGSTLRFVDINEERLGIYDRLAHKLNRFLKEPVTIDSTTERRAVLTDSDYVIISVDTGHYHTWEKDFNVPVQYGSRQILGELGGPGGLFHSLRQIPLHLEIARDIEALCPDAMVMVASNPLNRICLAMERYTSTGVIVGLCHGVEMALYLFLNRIMGVEGDDMEVTAAGTNHLTWILALRHKKSGEDLLPRLKESLAQMQTDEQALSRKLLEVYGYFPGTLDSHAGEYISYAHEFYGIKGIDFAAHLQQEENRWKYLRDLANEDTEWDKFEQAYGDQRNLSEELRLDPFFAPRSWADTLAFPIISAIIGNYFHRMPAINMVNTGQIANLPTGVFVETPAVVDGSGIYPVAMGTLPKALAAFNRRDIDQTELIIEAGATGDRNLVLQAMLLDPVIDNVRNAETMLDEMLKINARHLPQFA